MNFTDAKAELKRKIPAILPDCLQICFSFDPDDESIVYVRIYGIADDKAYAAHDQVWDLIDSLGPIEDVEFVPSIISMTNTRLYHPELLATKDDFDHALPDGIFPLLESLESIAAPAPDQFCPPATPRWSGTFTSSILDQIDEDPHERNDLKLAA